MRVLVVGGSGHVGTITLPLLAESHTIAVFDPKPPRPDVAVRHIAGDLRDVDAVRAAVVGADAVVFMAMGPKDGFGDLANARAQFDVAVTGLYTTLTAAREEGIGLAVYTSSMSVYAVDDPPLGEHTRYPPNTHPPDAKGAYGLAKRLGEDVCRAAADLGMDVVALRLCHPVADDDWPITDPPRHAALATSGRDTARAILAALAHRVHGFDAFPVSGDADGQLVDLTRTREVLGWEPLDPTR